MSDAAAIAREGIDAWNRRDWTRARELYHAQYTYTGSNGEVQKGPDAGLAMGQMWAAAFPDGKIDIKKIHAVGDTAISEYTGSGTHKGDLMGIAPTGKQIAIPICNVMEVRDGKIYAERDYMDMAHMMQQLGVMPEPAHA
jgi:steroid delta-isomerase-like uncharacterized protein